MPWTIKLYFSAWNFENHC